MLADDKDMLCVERTLQSELNVFVISVCVCVCVCVCLVRPVSCMVVSIYQTFEKNIILVFRVLQSAKCTKSVVLYI